MYLDKQKWPSTTPEGKVLLRAYVGKAGDESVVEQSDNEMVKIVLDDLKRIMKIDGEPEMTCITRWHEAMPQYHVGHKKRIKEIREGLEASYPGVFITGPHLKGSASLIASTKASRPSPMYSRTFSNKEEQKS